jgi:hypothetical protein
VELLLDGVVVGSGQGASQIEQGSVRYLAAPSTSRVRIASLRMQNGRAPPVDAGDHPVDVRLKSTTLPNGTPGATLHPVDLTLLMRVEHFLRLQNLTVAQGLLEIKAVSRTLGSALQSAD